MSQISVVLIAYDAFDEKAPLPASALDLAVSLGAKLRLVHVVPEVPSKVWKSERVSAEELQDAFVAARHDALDVLAKRAASRGLDVATAVRVGQPEVEIIREAERVDADLLVLIDRVPEGAGAGFHATTMKLLRASPCPVWAMRSPKKARRGPVVAAVDLGAPGAEENAPNASILALASTVAAARKVPLHVLHAWTLWGEHLLRKRLGPQELAKLIDEAQAREATRLGALVTTHAVPAKTSLHLERGEARAVLGAAVERLEAELVVMGTQTRTGLAGLLIGSTAERVIAQLACSVLAVKPEGFKSPVKASAKADARASIRAVSAGG